MQAATSSSPSGNRVLAEHPSDWAAGRMYQDAAYAMLNPHFDCVSLKTRLYTRGHFELERMMRERDESRFETETVRMEQVLSHALRAIEHRIEGSSILLDPHSSGGVSKLNHINAV